MRKNRSTNKKDICIIMTLLVLATLLSGCGKKDVDYVSEDETGTSTGVTVVTTSLREQYNIPETWEEENVDRKGTVDINAEIIVPNVAGMNVYEMSRKPCTSETKRELIELLSEGEVYKYDFEYYTKDMLLPYVEQAEQRIEYAEANGEYIDWPYLEDQHYEQLEEYTTMYENASEELIPADDYENSVFRIEYNDMKYQVNIKESIIEMELLDDYFSAYGAEEEYAYGIGINYDSTVSNAKDNMCNISKEDAQKAAVDFLEKIGINDFGIIDAVPAYFSGYGETSNDNWYNGYTIVLGRDIDGIVIDGYKMGLSYESTNTMFDIPLCQFQDTVDCNWEAGEFPVKSHTIERIYVVVNDEGVISFVYENPLQKDSVMAENVKLLSFDSIQSAVTTELYDMYYYENVRIARCELMYFPYRDEEEPSNIAIIPVWFFNDILNNTIVAINAIDGSVINLGLQYYEKMTDENLIIVD